MWVLPVGIVLFQVLASVFINRFMFHPIKGGYDKTLDGYVDIGTNGVSIAARIVGACKGKKVLMYCHGNAEDLTAIDGRFDTLVAGGYTVATFDYPGYGLSDGTPDEKGCYRNAYRLYDWLVCCRGISPKDIIVVGYSIGTGVATAIAESRKVGGLWLEAAYLSAPRAVTRIRLLFVDPFPIVDKIRHVKCPIVMLHGTSDSIIPYSHGRRLYDVAPNPKWFVPIDGAGHGDFIGVMGIQRYTEALRCFLDNGFIPRELCQ
jgi:hypothetical protein